jgi:hypothetical protein
MTNPVPRNDKSDLDERAKRDEDAAQKATLSFLRDCRHTAYMMWENAGQPWGMALDFWLAAQNVFQTVIDAAAKTVWGSEISEALKTQLRRTFPAKTYFDLTYTLAYKMSQHAERQYRAPLDIWLAAEKTIMAIVRGAISAASSALEVASLLNNELELFSPSAFLEEVRRVAYYKWVERGGLPYETHLATLRDWVEAEEEVRRQIAQGGNQGSDNKVLPPNRKRNPSAQA